MDMKNSMEKTERYQEQIKELFKELATVDMCVVWEDSFDIECTDEKHVTVVYHGEEKMKAFKKACKKLLISCIDSILGEGKKVNFVKKKQHIAVSSKTRKNIKAVKFFALGMLFVCLATAIVVVLYSYIENRNFRETFYSTSSIKIDNGVRVIQVSDLHGTSYGQDNALLVERITALKPDIIICTGDIVESAQTDVDYAVTLGRQLAQIAPTYYIYGNNEVETIYDFPLNEVSLDAKFGFDKSNRDEAALLNLEDTFETKLESAGVKVLKNEQDTIKIKSTTVDIYGVLTSNPSAFWSYSEKAFANYLYENPGNLKIMASHEPVLYEEFQPETWGDLIVCGHTHGGIVRMPVLGPLYTHEGGILPERGGSLVYGRYDTSGTPIVVSAGLENKSVWRINNQPELVVIDINKF